MYITHDGIQHLHVYIAGGLLGPKGDRQSSNRALQAFQTFCESTVKSLTEDLKGGEWYT